MPSLPKRIVALVLIPFLTADPALAAGVLHNASHAQRMFPALFHEQALSAAVVEVRVPIGESEPKIFAIKAVVLEAPGPTHPWKESQFTTLRDIFGVMQLLTESYREEHHAVIPWHDRVDLGKLLLHMTLESDISVRAAFAKVGGKIVGSLFWYVTYPRIVETGIYICNVAVARDHRHEGIASALWDTAYREMKLEFPDVTRAYFDARPGSGFIAIAQRYGGKLVEILSGGFERYDIPLIRPGPALADQVQPQPGPQKKGILPAMGEIILRFTRRAGWPDWSAVVISGLADAMMFGYLLVGAGNGWIHNGILASGLPLPEWTLWLGRSVISAFLFSASHPDWLYFWNPAHPGKLERLPAGRQDHFRIVKLGAALRGMYLAISLAGLYWRPDSSWIPWAAVAAEAVAHITRNLLTKHGLGMLNEPADSSMDTTAAQIGLRVLAQDPILGIVVSLDGRFASMSPAQREWLVQGIVRVNRAVFAAHNPTLDELTQGWDSELVSGNSIYLLIDPEGAIEGFSEFRVVNRIRVHGLMLATARTKKVKGEGTFLYEAALRDLAGQGFKICVWQSALEATGFQHRFLAQRMDYETLKGFTFAVNLTTLGTHSVNDGKIQSAYGELFDRRRAEVLRIVGRLPAGAYRLHYGQGTNVDYVKTPVNRWQLGENSLNLRIAGDLVKHLIETLVYNPAALLTRQSDARPFVSPSKIPDKVWINPRKAAWSLDRSA